MNVLVSGCGGDIGQSVGKILVESNCVNNLYGIDISDKNAAKFIYPNFFLGLPCNDDSYISFLEDKIDQYNIDIFIPISEPELRFFAAKNIRHLNGVDILMPSSFVMNVGFDKLKTAEFLKNNNFPFPKTFLLREFQNQLELPVIIKSRTGSGSSSVNMVEDLHHLDYLKRKHGDYIVQEFISGKDGEYTCGLFRSKDGKIRTIIFNRELSGGYSGYGEIIKNLKIKSLLEKLAVSLELCGSINVQLRISNGEPFVFEINPRFSSTVLFRHQFGFRDVEWSIQDLIGQRIGDFNGAKVKGRFYKGFNEYIEIDE